METKPFKLVVVGTSNKLARIAFALRHDDAHTMPAYPRNSSG